MFIYAKNIMHVEVTIVVENNGNCGLNYFTKKNLKNLYNYQVNGGDIFENFMF